MIRGRWWSTVVAAIAVVISLLVASAPVGAAAVVHESGSFGPYGFVDDLSSPDHAGALCKYTGSPIDWFRWMRVSAPQVYAANNNNTVREHRVVGWRVRLQRGTSPGGPWKTTLTSPEERATAYDDTPAVLHPIFVKRQSDNTQLIYRALVVIRWYHGGAVEGSAVLRIQYYHYRAADASPDFVSTDYCQNQTD